MCLRVATRAVVGQSTPIVGTNFLSQQDIASFFKKPEESFSPFLVKGTYFGTFSGFFKSKKFLLTFHLGIPFDVY